MRYNGTTEKNPWCVGVVYQVHWNINEYNSP